MPALHLSLPINTYRTNSIYIIKVYTIAIYAAFIATLSGNISKKVANSFSYLLLTNTIR
jgi:hypothetical protein